jgi:hypothetical protein
VIYQIAIQDRKENKFFSKAVTNRIEAIRMALDASKAGRDVYLACSGYQNGNSRKAANVKTVGGFWVDVDCGAAKADGGKGYTTPEDAERELGKFCKQINLPETNFLIFSGGGIHGYWLLSEALSCEAWLETAKKLKALTKALQFYADDSRTADPASVMRFPGSFNRKYEPAVPVIGICQQPEPLATAAVVAIINTAFEKFCAPQPTLVSTVADDLVDHTPTTGTDDTSARAVSEVPDLERLRSAMATLDPDCDDHTWKLHRIKPLARLAAAHPEQADALVRIARDFSSGALRGEPSNAWTTPGNTNGLTGEQAFDEVWQRFFTSKYSGREVTVGTIFHDARKAGWIDPKHVDFDIIEDGQEIDPETAAGDKHAETLKSAPKKTRTTRASNTADITEPLTYLQSRFCLINFDGKLWVIDLTTLNARTIQGVVKKLSLSTRSDGSLLLARALKAADLYADGGKTISKFYTSPATTLYDGVEFNPANTSGSSLNLWVGPTMEPQQGTWSLIRAFLLDIICAGDDRNYQYLIRFIAHALQRPWEKPGILVILLGGQGTGKGTGKGTLGKILRAIWSATYLHVHDISTVTGTFNASLERAFIVFMDEALFAGDRKASDSLKSVTSEEVININEKHQPARQVQSFHRFFAASNATHMKNTERDDRRDFVLRVSEARKGDHEYWSALNAEMNDGGVAAMVHDLLALNLAEFNVRAKPNTGELVEQKLLSLDPTERYWYEFLLSEDHGDDGKWPDFMPTEGLINGIVDLAGKRLYRNPSASEVVKAVMRMCPSATKAQKQDNHNRARGLTLPTKDVARLEFAKFIGGGVNWD